MRLTRILITTVAVVLLIGPRAWAQAPTVQQYLGAAWPYELVSAKKADRIAWIADEKGARNVYTAAAPDFKPIRLTRFLGDNGIDLTSLRISDDGSTLVFVRGHLVNREGWVANPTSNPDGAERAIWAVRTTGGGAAWRLGEGNDPQLSPDGRTVVYAKDGQIYRYRVTQMPATAAMDKGEQPFIKAFGRNSGPRWSPDGAKIAFVSDRADHSYVAVYDVKGRTVTYMAPDVDRDSSPTWSADSKRVAFIRRPGLPFALHSQAGSGGIGNPAGPAAAAAAARGARPGAAPEGRGGAGMGGGQRQAPAGMPAGLYSSTFKGGYTLAFWSADAATGEGREFWHAEVNEATFPNIRSIEWAGEAVIFQAEPEEWIRYYSVPVSGSDPAVRPAALTPGEGMVEFTALSSDGRTLFYCTNAGDIDGRNIWKVPTAGGEAVQITKGEEIETYPVALSSGKQVAVLAATWQRPQSVALVPAAGGDAKVIFPVMPKDFPAALHVRPQNVITKAPDGLEIHNQIFLPSDLKPGERRPAVVFVHGGPVRQMLLAYHYRYFYHLAYGVNQWLANQGYVVLSINYRSGIGYGKSFRMAPNVGARGNAEYQDVLAGAKYLQSRSDVDPERIGIWGLSYGGLLTAQALARNSDIFKVGVDMAGVHLFGNSLDPESVSYQSSAISQVANWKSPVLLRHGDDDRNVAFTQTTGLVQLLRAHNVYYELIVFPDDVHDPLLHKRWMYEFERTGEFLGRFLKRPTSSR